MKNYIKVNQTIHSKTPIPESYMDSFMDDYIKLVESYGLRTVGTFSLLSEEEFHDELLLEGLFVDKDE